MESDLSLIEIAGEDDSLLQQTPALDKTTTAATNYCFSCSPLQIPGSNRNSHRSSRFSPIMGLKDNADVEKPSCSSPIGSSNKENVNAKKSEVPKLSVDSHQMKRRKRAGAYNLRKSLAWDRAFFTEEGVLNSLELSMLSGSFGSSSGVVLPTIHEQGRKLPGDSGSTSDSAVLQVLEENIFKENPPTNSNGRNNGCSLLTKRISSAQDNAAPTSVGTPKMLSSQRGNRIGSKSGGCPRPLLSSSLKRPANASTTKSAMKESKIPKIPASRSGAYSLPKTNKNNVLSTSHSKHNQTGQTDIVQNSAGLQGSFKNTKSSATAKTGSNSSSLQKIFQHPRRNMAKSALEVRSSTNPQPPLVMKANCGLEVFPAAVLPPSGSRAPDAHNVSRKTGVLPQNTHYVSGNMRDTQFQTTKPSGLRMPSPSLGFFCQPKSSASNSSSQKATQPSNIPKSYIPGLPRLNISNFTHDPRLLHAPGKMPKMDNNATISGNSSTECSLLSACSDASHENGKLKLEGSNALTVEDMLPSDPKSSELMKENQQEHKIVGGDKGFQECGEAHKDDQSSSKENSSFQMNDDNWLSQSRSSDQLKKDSNNEVTIACPGFIYSKMNEMENSNFASQHSCAVLVKGVPEANDSIKHQHVKNKQCSYPPDTHEVISGYQPEHASGDIKQAFVVMHNDSSSDIHVNEWSTLKAELVNASAGKADQIPHGGNPNLTRNDEILLEGDGRLFESQKYKRENFATVNSNICESNGSEKLSSNSPPHEGAEKANEGAAGVDQLSDKLSVEHVQVHFLDETLLVKNCDNQLRTSEVHDQYLVVDDDNKKTGEHPKLQSCCLLVEQASKLNHGFLVDDSSLLSQSTPAEESQGVYDLEVALNVIQEKGEDFGSKLNCSNVVITQDPGAIQDGGVDVHEMVEQAQVKAALSSSAEMDPSVEDRNIYVDTQFKPDLSLNKITDQTAGAVTTCNSMAFTSSSKEEVMGANGLKNNIFTEKADTKVSSGNPLKENERIKMNGGILFGESGSHNELHTGDLVNTTDVGLIHQGSTGSELNSCQIASLLEDTEQVNECAAGLGHMTNDLCVGDTKVQSLDANLLVGTSNGRLSNLAMDSQCLMIVTDVNGQSGKQPELQTPGLVVDHIFQDNHGLHLNDYFLLGKGTGSEEPREEKVLANDPIVQEKSDVDGGDLKSSRIVIQVPLSMQDSGADVERMIEHQLVEDAPSGSADSGSSIDNDKYSIDIHFENDMVFSVQATSSKSDSPYKAICSSEESGFSVKRIQTLANETNVMDIVVDKMNNILPDDNDVKISQKNVNPGELQHKLDDAICLTEDKDTTMSIKKSEDDGKQNNLMINPTVNAVPFSDEWLAAMEAAGEEILTMKSGAVQNSPPDKPLPEPGPWSPVKRKQNSIGPFDCTKFINIPPPNSD